MNRRTFLKTVPAVAVLAAKGSSFAQETTTAPSVVGALQPIMLPKPAKDGGKSVMAALWERKTIREISDKKLSPQMLSDLLWAAWGVNRENGPRGRIGRTAASARNSQEIDLYVVLAEGIYLYEALPHRLVPVAAGDHRGKLGSPGRSESAIHAPVTLIFVADVTRYGQGASQAAGDTEAQKLCYYVATGLIAGNVHLFAAAHGLAAWFHGCDKAALSSELKLRPEHRLIYAQTVGYPA